MKLFKFELILFLTFININFSIALSNRFNIQNLISQELNYKFIFTLRLPTSINEQSHPLNQATYKNILLKEEQIVFSVSKNQFDSVKL